MSTLVSFSNPMGEETTSGAIYAMPATPFQERLWNLARTNGPDAAWNVAVRFRLSGFLDREKLERSLQLLTARHEALRTSLTPHPEGAIQSIAARVTLPVEWCDLRPLRGEAQAAEVLHLSLEHARQPFLLENAPLLRVRMLRLEDKEHLLLLNAHHAICDGWSVGILARNLMNFYGELVSGKGPELASTLDFGDYAVWLKAQRNTPEYEIHRSYWKRTLRGSRVPELPPSWRNAESVPSAPVIHSRLLPRKLTDRFAAVAQRHDATFFHSALTAFAVLMRSQQESAQIAVGIPLSGRDHAELEDVVGPFVNYVPLHFSVDEKERYNQVLRSVRDHVNDSLEHAQLPFEDILAGLHEQGTPDRADKLFSTVFICQRDFVRPIASAELALTALPSVSPGALRPLTVFMVEREDGWRLSCEVDNRVVSADAGARLLEDFERLIAAITVHSEEPVTLVAARAGLATHFGVSNEVNAQGSENIAPQKIEIQRDAVRIPATEFQRRFWQLDGMNPGAAAFHIRVRMELKGSLNVQALELALEDLSHRHEILRTTLEEKDGRIWQVIHPELSIDFRSLVSDSHVPDAQRTSAQREADRAILDDEGSAKFSLTTGPLFRTRVLQLEEDRHWLAITLSHGIADGWATGLFLEQLQQAYERRLADIHDQGDDIPLLQFSDYAEAEQRLLAGPEKDRRMQWWTKYLQGIWKPLALPRDLDGSSFDEGDVPAALEVTLLPPEVAVAVRRFAREFQTTQFAVFGALFQALLFRYTRQTDALFMTPHANRTGDTESIVGPMADPICLTAHLDSTTTFRDLVTRFSLQSIDAMENALPLNAVTPFVDMRVLGGYHPLSQIVFFYQRAFVHNMEWKGLHVQSLPDVPSVTGSEWQLGIVERGENIFLEFLYDATLYSRSTIQTVGSHFTTLLASAIAEPEMSLEEIEILTLREIEHVASDASASPVLKCLLPRESGIDAAKATPVQSQDATAAAKQGFSQVEGRILEIWQKLFKIEDLDASSNFFDLGGHSLLLVRLQIAMKKEFQVQLTAADVFRNPTIATLANWLERKQSLAAQESVQSNTPAIHNPRIVPIQLSGAGTPIFVISQSMIFRTLAAELGTDQPMYAVQMLEEDEAAMESASYEELIEFYVRLIREVQPNGPYRVAGWCVSAWIAYGVARRLEKQNAKIELLVLLDAWAPGYWSGQPPIRKRIMLAIYEMQRSRWAMRQLKKQRSSQSGELPADRNPSGLAAVMQKILSRFRRGNRPSSPREEEEWRRSQQLQRTADRAALEGPLQGTAVLFRSEEEPAGPLLAPDMGWAQLMERDVRAELLPGDHHQIFDLPGARMMAVRCHEMLNAASTFHGPSDTSVLDGTRLPASRNVPVVEV